jgi:hypothetical protein
VQSNNKKNLLYILPKGAVIKLEIQELQSPSEGKGYFLADTSTGTIETTFTVRKITFNGVQYFSPNFFFFIISPS